MALEGCEKKVFGTPWGLFEFQRMPFGFNRAAAMFQRFMDQILITHQSRATAYVDYVILFLNHWQQNPEHLRVKLGELGVPGLTANHRKGALGQEEMKYLGSLVGQGKIKPLMDKVEALRTYKVPQTREQVKSFVGLAKYHKVTPHFSELIAPLMDLMKGQGAKPVV